MEQLIRDLNSPANQGNPHVINDIQRQIQRLQSESAAWQVALDLLNKPDTVLQFYGALTLSLKVDADWDQDGFNKDRERVAQLIQLLVSRFIELAHNAVQMLVITKLSATLAAIWAKPEAAWAHPPRQLLACALAGHYISESEIPSVDSMLSSTQGLKGSVLQSILRLSLAMHEESVSNKKTQSGHGLRVKLSNNASDVWQILLLTLSMHGDYLGVATGMGAYRHENINLQTDAKIATSWACFADAMQQIPAWSDLVTNTSSSTHLQTLFAKSFQTIILLLDQPSCVQVCLACVSTMQSENPRLLRQAVTNYQAQINNLSMIEALSQRMLGGEFSPECNAYMDYLQAVVEQYDCTTDEYLKDANAITALSRVQALSHCPGPAMVEDESAQIVLEMLSTIAEGYCEWDGDSPFDASMRSLLKDASLAILTKIRIPDDQLDRQAASWDEDDFTEFEDYRFQATSFFETAYAIFGVELLQLMTESLGKSETDAWSGFDAVLFVLVSISDALDSLPEKCDPTLNYIFASGLWQRAISASPDISGRIQWAAIKIISQYTSFLQRNSQHMLSSLDFLFRCLQRKGYANQAAKAINVLCDNQRSFLVEGLPQFLQTLSGLNNIALSSRQKVLSAVAALIQALPNEQMRVEPLQHMIKLVQNFEHAPSSNDDESDDTEDPLHHRMAMLAAVAKGLQSPADSPIDLENATVQEDAAFWIDGPGNSIQQAVLGLISDVWNNLLNAGNSDLVGYACEFLRAGFKEEHPCALKFMPSISTQLLLTMIDLRNSNLDQTMTAVSCFLASLSATDSSTTPEINAIFNRIILLTQECTSMLRNNLTLGMKNPSGIFSPPGSILDLIIRTLTKHGLHIFSVPTAPDSMSIFFEYGLLILRASTDTLPRRSATSFFASFVDLTDPSSTYAQTSVVNAALTALLDRYGPSILGLTLHFLAGECARSEIETFTQVLKVFVMKQGLRSKKIVQQAMMPESGVLTPKALNATKPEQRARFIAQIEALRGGKKTSEITKDFWISCRGGQFGYVT